MPSSQARIEANRKNGRKSKGPLSEASKQKSALNALKHGMFSKKNVLPTEDPALFCERITAVHGSLNPRNQAEYLLANEVGRSSWLYDRALRAQTARISKNIYESSFQHEEIVHGWGRRLFFDRRGPTSLYGIGKGNGCGGRTSYSGIPDDPDDPARLIRLISRSSYGCKWMLARWNGLRELLVTGRTWQAQHRLMATRLMGHQPLDACTVEDVAQVYLRSWTINQERENAWREHRSELRREEYYRFCQRVRGQHGLVNSHDKAQERATLVFVVDKVIADVEEKLALAEAREAKEAALDADCLAFDDSPEGERLRRYELAAHRKLMRTIDTFLKIRKADLEETEDDAGGAGSVYSQQVKEPIGDPPAEPDYRGDIDEPAGDPESEFSVRRARDQVDPTNGASDSLEAIDPSLTITTLTAIDTESVATPPARPETLPLTGAEDPRNDPNPWYKVEPIDPDAVVSETQMNDPHRSEHGRERGGLHDNTPEREPAQWLPSPPALFLVILLLLCSTLLLAGSRDGSRLRWSHPLDDAVRVESAAATVARHGPETSRRGNAAGQPAAPRCTRRWPVDAGSTPAR
jgi:hypothetical protein